jgi:4-amino-4-deoxychorismate lyase
VENLWLVNGRPGQVDPADRGIAYGDGLFETMLARDGRIRWLDYHLARLLDGCSRLGIDGVDEQSLRAEITAHLPSRPAVVKLIVTRGVGIRGYRPPHGCEPTRILAISSWSGYPADHYTSGIRVRTCELRLGENPRLAGMKHLNRLEQVLASKEIEASGADEGLLLDTSGRVVGGGSTNVFVVRRGRLLTPSIERSGIRGVMRRIVLEAAVAAGIDSTETELERNALDDADELFVTNALSFIRPVRELDGRAYAIGPVTRQLMTSVDERHG